MLLMLVLPLLHARGKFYCGVWWELRLEGADIVTFHKERELMSCGERKDNIDIDILNQ